MQIAGCCIINHIQGIIKDHAGEASHPSGYGYGFGINSRFFRMGCLGRRFAIEKEEVLMDPRVWMGVTVTGLPGTTPLLPPPAPASDNVGTSRARAASLRVNQSH